LVLHLFACVVPGDGAHSVDDLGMVELRSFDNSGSNVMVGLEPASESQLLAGSTMILSDHEVISTMHCIFISSFI